MGRPGGEGAANAAGEAERPNPYPPAPTRLQPALQIALHTVSRLPSPAFTHTPLHCSTLPQLQHCLPRPSLPPTRVCLARAYSPSNPSPVRIATMCPTPTTRPPSSLTWW